MEEEWCGGTEEGSCGDECGDGMGGREVGEWVGRWDGGRWEVGDGYLNGGEGRSQEYVGEIGLANDRTWEREEVVCYMRE